MARRTPPIEKQVVEPYYASVAFYKARLIDFDTASSALEEQHKTWLRSTIHGAKANSGYYIQMIGYTSKLGDQNFNRALSLRRMNSVLNFLKDIDPNAMSNLEGFYNYGELESTGGEDDDSAYWRAVEVHLTVGSRLPPPPPPKKYEPLPTPKLPGGPRYSEWEFGYTSIVDSSLPLPPPFTFIVVGVHVFVIRAKSNGNVAQEHGYVVPVAGGGLSMPLKDFLKWFKYSFAAMKGGLSVAKAMAGQLSFKDYKTKAPTTFEEIENSPVAIAAAAAGVSVGFGVANVTIAITDRPQLSSGGGSIITKQTEDINLSYTSTMQLGAKMSVTGGKMIRVD